MKSLNEYGEALMLAHTGQQLIAREIAAFFGRVGARALRVATEIFSKVPPAEA